jgi:hypothetical protein
MNQEKATKSHPQNKTNTITENFMCKTGPDTDTHQLASLYINPTNFTHTYISPYQNKEAHYDPLATPTGEQEQQNLKMKNAK